MPDHISSSPASITSSNNIFCHINKQSKGVCDTALTSSSGSDSSSALNNIFIEQRDKSVTSPCK